LKIELLTNTAIPPDLCLHFSRIIGTHDDFIIVNDAILDSLLIDENSRKHLNIINALHELGIPIQRYSKDISHINNYGTIYHRMKQNSTKSGILLFETNPHTFNDNTLS
jgi:hypothetical protein